MLADRLHERVRREKWPADPFVVHHGSLSKDLREDAEATLKSGVPTTALCSSTLEMGIDIGHIRAVGQLDTPWSVSSMVQRLGRSGRRAGETAIMRMYVREESPHAGSTLTDLLYPDLLRAIAMTRLMLAKWLEPFDATGCTSARLLIKFELSEADGRNACGGLVSNPLPARPLSKHEPSRSLRLCSGAWPNTS